MFQFLIGRLSTDFGKTPASISGQFQFLIGRLSTGQQTLTLVQMIGGFNSLQVDYQRYEGIKMAKKNRVSIPYRQTINSDSYILLYFLEASFNSLQVDYQLAIFSVILSLNVAVSIPYRQTINQLLCRRVQFFGYRSFNSLQVDYQPSKSSTSNNSSLGSFNSLQVDYQRNSNRKA